MQHDDRSVTDVGCHPNATLGVLPSPLSKYPSTTRRKFNAGSGIRTHTLVPQERVLSRLCLPRKRRDRESATPIRT